MVTNTRRPAQRRSLALIALLLVLAGAMSLAGGALATGQTRAEQTPTPAPSEELLPNTPLPASDEPAPAAPDATGGGLWPDPFPPTGPVTATIEAALADFEQRAARGEELDKSVAEVWPQNIPPMFSMVFLPRVVRQADAAPGPGVTPTPEPEEPDPADVAVALWAEPSIRVARGGTLAYEIRVRNYGPGAARSTQVTLPFDRRQIVPVGSALNQGAGDWVSALSDTSLTVTFGKVDGHGSRSGWIFFRVAGGLANDTVISMRGTYTWDGGRHGSGSTNWAPVLVGGGNDTAAYVWTIVSPVSEGPWAKRSFFSDRFAPGEGITTWLNTPTGVRPLDVRGVADPMGRVWLEYTPADLAPGSYQLVLYGNRSQLTGVAGFVVR